MLKNSLTYLNQLGEVWKRVSCHGNRLFIAVGVCKLAKIVLLTYFILWVESMASLIISFAYFTHISNKYLPI